MLTLNDGRSELWQWDTCRTLAVDADCSQVHFSNKVFGRSLDVDVIGGVANIPDILLQTDKDLTAWAFVGTPENGYTKISKVFKVNRRNKPADYVFTPTEQTTLGEILERLDDIESAQDPDAIKNAVEDYLDNNPIQIEETDPTVPAWAKAPEKPSYTAEEVGALPADTEIPEQLQADYAQNDSTAADYVKNRTHYEETVEEYVCFEAYMEYGTSQTASIDYEVPDGAECTVYIDGVVFGNNPAPVYGGGYVMVSPDMYVHFDNAAHTVQVGNYWNAGTVKVVVNKLFVVKQLDEKYIPDTIARAEDIPEIPAIPTTLPNPHKLTFSGAVSAEYDGSEAVEVVIPQGGGSGLKWVQIANVTTEEAVREIVVDEGIPDGVNGLFFRIETKQGESSTYNYIAPTINGAGFLGANLNLNTGTYLYDITSELHEDGTMHNFWDFSNIIGGNLASALGSFNGGLPVTSVGVVHAGTSGTMAAGTVFKVWARVGG